MTYLTLKFKTHSPSGLTSIFWLVNNQGEALGEVRWYSKWRKYCFFPSLDNPICLDDMCLIEMAGLLANVTKEHKEKLNEVKTPTRIEEVEANNR
jgi:hypothetical protein